jgi:hypothetical protein
LIKIFLSYKNLHHTTLAEICNLSDNVMDYRIVSQGKTTIPGVDDGEECEATDARQKIV